MKRLDVTIRLVGLAALMGMSWPALAQSPLSKPEDVGLSSAKLALIPEAVKIQIEAGQIPGAIVLVARDGKVVHSEAQGVTNAVSKEPLQTEKIFGAGSLTKPMVAVAAMMLVEEGKLGLDDPVSKYIPEFGQPRQVRVLKPGSPPAPINVVFGPGPPSQTQSNAEYDLVPAVKPITLRMLLTHTSGMHIFGLDNAFPLHGPTDTLAGFVPKLASVPLEYQPGSRWAYSNNIDFEVIGRMIEVASGMSLKQFLQQRLLGPLEMHDTDFGVRQDGTARGLPYAPELGLTKAEEVKYFNASAGLWTTVADYEHFASMLANNGSYHGRQLLKPETIKEMASNQIGSFVMAGYPTLGIPLEGLKFGFGFLVVTSPHATGSVLPVGSFGWNGDGTRLLWVIPEQHIVILSMVPLVGPEAAPLQRTIEAIVMSSIIRQ